MYIQRERSEAAMRAGDFEVKYKGCDSPLKLVGTTEDSMIHPTSVYGITKPGSGAVGSCMPFIGIVQCHIVTECIWSGAVSF